LLRDQIKELFHKFDPATQQLISEVIDLEQSNISLERPRIQKELDDIIARIAKQELAKDDTTQTKD
jgi:hypothetical protein